MGRTQTTGKLPSTPAQVTKGLRKTHTPHSNKPPHLAPIQKVTYSITIVRCSWPCEKEPRNVTGSPFCNLISRSSPTIAESTFCLWNFNQSNIYHMGKKSNSAKVLPCPAHQRQTYLTISLLGSLGSLKFLNNRLLPLLLHLSLLDTYWTLPCKTWCFSQVILPMNPTSIIPLVFILLLVTFKINFPSYFSVLSTTYYLYSFSQNKAMRTHTHSFTSSPNVCQLYLFFFFTLSKFIIHILWCNYNLLRLPCTVHGSGS